MKPRKSSILLLCTLYFVTLHFSACRPNGILSSRQLREVLVDLHQTDALIQVMGWQHGNDDLRDEYYAAVLANHHVTQAQFDSSIVWYTQHPQLFDKIYPKVLKELHSQSEAFAAAHPELLAPSKEEPTSSKHILTDKEAYRQVDSLIWTMHYGAPVYGWFEGWKKAPPTVPFEN